MSDSADDIQVKDEPGRSEAKALSDILEWSHDCPEWQQDALRRLCVKGELDENDIDELTNLCKDGGKGGTPLSADHLPDPDAAAMTVNLGSIHSTENINSLKPGERLTFDKNGLTVVYGDNGTGKSGYARIMKRACRARISSKGNKIHPNIYETEPGSQKAMIDFSVNGCGKSQGWTLDAPANPFLSAVSVFDSETANVYVDEANAVAYTPFPMRVLERLANAAQEIKKRIDSEIQELKRQTPEAITKSEFCSETAVGRLIIALDGTTKEENIRILATLTEKDKSRYETLISDLARNSAKAALQIDSLKRRLNDVDRAFASLQNAISDEQVKRLIALHRAYLDAKETAKVAAVNLFTDDPLPNIGSDIWRSLWESARRYSEQQAYPGIPFPMIDEGARCVLCQQEIGAEAIDRLARFESFVKDETKREEARAQKAYQTALDTLVSSAVPSANVLGMVALIRDEINDEDLAKTVRRAAASLMWRLRKIRHDHTKSDDLSYFPHAESWPAGPIAMHRDTLSQRAATLRTEDESEERNLMRAEIDEYSDRERLSVIKEDVIAEIARRKKRSELEVALKDTKTNRITAMSGSIAEQLVTDALSEKLSREINKLGMHGLEIELRKEKANYGVPRFRVNLIRSQNPYARIGEILSEGEHRCVALASFLAELATTGSRSAIVFDDPVSSLDHMHRKVVAERLADEGKYRQVIVLTHDIAFLLLLDHAARGKGINITSRSVTRNDDYTGFVQKDSPLRARSIDKVIDGIQKQLDKEKIFYERGDNERWEQTVDALQKRLRWTWERAVEEVISPVFKRMSEKVNTGGLSKITVIEENDCTEMRDAYGRCSSMLHSSPDTLSLTPPNPKSVQEEINALRDWIKDIEQRQKKIR